MKRQPDEEKEPPKTLEEKASTKYNYNGVKKYKSDLQTPTYDVVEYQWRITDFNAKRSVSTSNFFNKRLDDTFYEFAEVERYKSKGSSILAPENRSTGGSFTSGETEITYETHTSAESDVLTKKEREVAQSNAREPGYRFHQGVYDPSNIENFPENLVKVKSSIEPELDCAELPETDLSNLVKLLKDDGNTTAPPSSHGSEDAVIDEEFSVTKEIEVTTTTTKTTATTTTTITEETDTTTTTTTTKEETQVEEKKTEQLCISINTTKK